jgi:secreted trypsin-like serine protease
MKYCHSAAMGILASLTLAGCSFDVKPNADEEFGETTDSQTNAITYGALDGSVHPEVVSLWLEAPGRFTKCSGVTISERYIVTAGHCVDSLVGFPPSLSGTINLRVRFAANGESPATVYSGSARAALHPQYISTFAYSPCSNPQYDIALIKLGSDAADFRRARLQVYNALMPSRQEMVGWGAHWFETIAPGTFRMMGITNLAKWGGNGYIFVNSDPASADGGDSGGGLFVKPSSSSDKRVLTGTIAAGTRGHTCGPLIALNLGFILEQAESWGRPLSCELSSLGNVQFLASCND